MRLKPNASEMNMIVPGLNAVPTVVAVRFADVVAAKAKKRNMVVPTNSPINATKSTHRQNHCLSLPHPSTYGFWSCCASISSTQHVPGVLTSSSASCESPYDRVDSCDSGDHGGNAYSG